MTQSCFLYNDGTEVSTRHLLEWRGQVQIRYDPEKDDVLRLHGGKEKWCDINESDIVFLGRKPGIHTVREAIEKGKLGPELFDW